MIRPLQSSDVEPCARILFEAFQHIAQQHNFPADFPNIEFTRLLVGSLGLGGHHYAVVAELDGEVVGSNFLSEVNDIRSVGPISVAPNAQGRQVGRKLMQAVIERGSSAAGIRLVQDGFNMLSLSLYASLGFQVREPLLLMKGKVAARPRPESLVRPMTLEDHPACSRLGAEILGFSRVGELQVLPPFARPLVLDRGGRIVAYATSLQFWPTNHAVAESHEDLQDLLSGCEGELNFVLPVRDTRMLRWCLAQGLRAVKPMNLMSLGQYEEPRSVWLPSVAY